MKHLNSYKTFESMQRDNCDRCEKPTHGETIMSMFNQQVICMPCKKKEQEHRDYAEAREADYAAIKSGNYNFKGKGKPEDL